MKQSKMQFQVTQISSLNKGVLNSYLNTKKLNTYSSSSETTSSKDQLDGQNESRRKYLLDEEDEQRLRDRLKVNAIAARCSVNLVEAVFREVFRREYGFRQLMTAEALEQVCLAVIDKQQREPIRMLPNLINTYLDNIMLGIKAAGNGNANSPPYQFVGKNSFNSFEQHQYDFEKLENELLSN